MEGASPTHILGMRAKHACTEQLFNNMQLYRYNAYYDRMHEYLLSRMCIGVQILKLCHHMHAQSFIIKTHLLVPYTCTLMYIQFAKYLQCLTKS